MNGRSSKAAGVTKFRLKRVESDTNGRMLNARYGVDGLRTKKQDANGNSSREYGAGISTSASTPLTQNSTAPSISYISGPVILGAEIDGNWQFWLTDALGTVRDVVDENGDVIRSQEYDEHGNQLSSFGTGTFAPKTYQGGLSVNDDRSDSGLYLMGHRHYASELGRFISRDPIGFQGGLNLFGTSFGNNPMTFVDPTGLDEEGPPDHPNEILYQNMKARSNQFWKQYLEEFNNEWNCRYQSGLDLASEYVKSRRPDLAPYLDAAKTAQPVPGTFLLDLVGANMRTSFDTSTISVSPDTMMGSLFSPEFIAWNLLHEGVHVKRGTLWNTLHPREKEKEAYRIINDDVLADIVRFSQKQEKKRKKLCK